MAVLWSLINGPTTIGNICLFIVFFLVTACQHQNVPVEISAPPKTNSDSAKTVTSFSYLSLFSSENKVSLAGMPRIEQLNQKIAQDNDPKEKSLAHLELAEIYLVSSLIPLDIDQAITELQNAVAIDPNILNARNVKYWLGFLKDLQQYNRQLLSCEKQLSAELVLLKKRVKVLNNENLDFRFKLEQLKKLELDSELKRREYQ